MTTRPRDVAYGLADRLWSTDKGAIRGAVSLGLLPLSGLWRAGVWWRNRHFDDSDAGTVPGVLVVSVGNLAVGGTGKSPLTSWVAGVLEEAGQRAAILRRDHGDDETLLHRTWRPGTPVFAGPDRVTLAAEARDQGVDVVVLDDGFQHRGLARDLDLVLLAVEDGAAEPLLPRGRFREPLATLRRADVVILTRRGASVEDARRVAENVADRIGRECDVVRGCVHLAPGTLDRFDVWAEWCDPLRRATPRGSVEAPLVVTAVARPREVLRDVASVCSGTATLVSFPDHHDYDAADVARIRRLAKGRPVVVTEKDAVKFRRLADLPDDMWVLGQELIWDWGIGDVTKVLVDLAGSDRP